ncbi:hypothetical protein D3C71_262640 [compost metagenome]
MKIEASSPEQYIDHLPEDRRQAVSELKRVISENLPKGFSETVGYGMIAFVVPHSLYPKGYHCDPKLALPFINIASQKNFIALYHMGLYADKELHDWFVNEYPKHCKTKLDMGKSCIRFKKPDQIPFDLIAELATKMSVADWVNIYEHNLQR